MFARFTIRSKLLVGVAMLTVIVIVLAIGGLSGVLAYRRLARSVSHRAAELPKAAELMQSVNDLRITFGQIRAARQVVDQTQYDSLYNRDRFILDLIAVNDKLRRYRDQLKLVEPNGSDIVDNRDEWETVQAIERTLNRISRLNHEADWVLEQVQVEMLEMELESLHELASILPSHLQQRMQHLKGNARGEYHMLIALTSTTSVLAGLMLLILFKFFTGGVFRPLEALIRGSRRVASGDFNHRIEVDAQDEIAELAAALNDMTKRFCQIRDDLDHQVKQRTTEVVRSEQLASVGFLAAGVAHEINNPLASIAWCAESLESRLHGILYADGADEDHGELKVLRTYLRRIQEEAFRCKGITEGLLDFSRLGDVEKHNIDLREVVTDVIDLVKHLGRYRNKRILFRCERSVIAPVHAQEMKQVVLNLVTNALDSLDPDGVVEVELCETDQRAQLRVTDNGCGMSEEVLKHLFEPFFTRRRDGQGTGLGLSITYRIVQDHGGSIEVFSAGPGHGSRFTVTLPLVQQHNEEKQQIEQRAA